MRQCANTVQIPGSARRSRLHARIWMSDIATAIDDGRGVVLDHASLISFAHRIVEAYSITNSTKQH